MENISDPTNLKNVLNALRNSTRLKHWDKPPKDYGPDNPEDSEYNTNSLKWVGDMSGLTLSPGFSFGGESGDESEQENDTANDNDVESDSGEESTTSSKQEWIDPGEELGDESTCEALITGQKALYTRQLIEKMEEMKLEEEIKQNVKRKCKEKYNDYMKQLGIIYRNAEIQKIHYCDQRNKSLEIEEDQLRKREESDAKSIKKQEEEYSQYISQESRKLLAIVEEAQRKEAEQASQRRALLNQLQNSKGSFISKISEMNQQLNDLQDKQYVEGSTESFLNETLSHISGVIEGAEQEVISQPELQQAQITLQEAINYVDNLNATLKTKIEEKKHAQLEAQNRAAKEAAEAAAAAAASQSAPQPAPEQVHAEKTESTPEQGINSQPEGGKALDATTLCITLIRNGKKRLEELRKKVEPYLTVHEQLDNKKRMDLNRATGVINQLNLINHSLNREKLQTMIKLLSGRQLQVGNKMYSTENDPVSLAYVKNHTASMIVKLGHDKQAGGGVGVAAYSWLMTELIQIYPDMWDLFLYHIFETCPYLIPIYPLHEDGQSEEEFEKARGLYKKEKEDAFYGRMGNAALMYGLVLYKLKSKPESPINTPVIGWELLVKICSLPPISGVTASVLFYFLSGFGVGLQQVYAKQFSKLIHYLSEVYMPKIGEATVMGGVQSLDQLKKIMDMLKKGRSFSRYEHVDKFK